MIVAAMGLAAIASMRPDQTWTPPLGRLFVRTIVTPHRHDVEFNFADDAKHSNHTRSIARIRGWSGEPSFGGWIDCAEGNFDIKYLDRPIVRRLADEDDVRALVKLWASRVSLAEWVESVEAEKGLCDEDKAMVRRVALGESK